MLSVYTHVIASACVQLHVSPQGYQLYVEHIRWRPPGFHDQWRECGTLARKKRWAIESL